MKIKLGMLAMTFAFATLAHGATNDLTGLLQKGLFEEEANRDLTAAIANYQSLANAFDKDRQLAATAVFRLGECYRKLGKTNEAAAQYQRILKDFSGEQTLVTLSRQNLAGLGSSVAPAAATSNPIASEQARQLAWVKKLQTMPLSEVRQIAPTVLTDATLVNLIYQYNQADLDLIRLRADHGEQHPEVQKEKAIQSALQDKIKERLRGMETALSMETGMSAASSGGGNGMAAEPVTDEEQQQIRRIQLMIQNSPDLINAVGPDGITPLQDAAMKGQLSVAKYLLDHGADVNRTGSSAPAWEPALFKAANNGHKAMVELLISRGADVNSLNPLERVVSRNFTSVAEVLLAHNANVNAHGSEARVPLHDAAENGATNLIRLLIDHGADLSAVDNRHATPLHLAARAGQMDAAKMLVAAKAPLEARDQEGNTPLHEAAAHDHAKIVSLLLDSGASVDATNYHNATPLLLAVNDGGEEAVRVLLAHKADPNKAGGIQNSPGSYSYPTRPIYSAIRHTNILEMLLNAGADPEGQPDLPYTPLGVALERQSIESVRLLLEHGANPNHDSADSPLAIALGKSEDKSIIPLLLEKGADPNGKNKDGLTPLFLTSDPDIGRWLIEHKADVNARFTDGEESRNGMAGRTVQNGMLVGGGSSGFLFAYTPLMRAAVKAPEFAKFLLENGAKPDLQDTNGNTALHYAAFYAEPDGVSVLLDHKANPNLQNNAGYTPLDIAKSGTGGNIEYGMLGGINNHVGTGTSAEKEKQIAELLTRAGGLANLPKRNRIEVRRGSAVAFTIPKDTEGRNHYSLLESIAIAYGLLGQQTSGEWGATTETLQSSFNLKLRFPDFKHVVVYRRKDDSTKQTALTFDVESMFNAGDCSRDISLDWGDVVEIPEIDHPVEEQWAGLPFECTSSLIKCLARQATVVIKGESTVLKLAPGFRRVSGVAGDPMRTLVHTSFMLRSVLDNSKLVRVSSDLSRVKVTRIDPETKKKAEWTIDCTNPSQADLWLRDGDVVDVPER